MRPLLLTPFAPLVGILSARPQALEKALPGAGALAMVACWLEAACGTAVTGPCKQSQ